MSNRKDLTTTGNKEISLHDNGLKAGSLIEQSVRSLNQDQIQALGSEAAKEMIRLEIKQREINLEYVAGKKSAEDHVETVEMLGKEGGVLTRQSVKSEIKTGAGKMHIESKSGATCFVATATYRDSLHPDVIFLRFFRDNSLIHFKLGVKFINWYWIFGPKLARHVENSKFLRLFSKIFLGLLVKLLRNIYFSKLSKVFRIKSKI